MAKSMIEGLEKLTVRPLLQLGNCRFASLAGPSTCPSPWQLRLYHIIDA